MPPSFQVSIGAIALLGLALLPATSAAESYRSKKGADLIIKKEIFICDEAQRRPEIFRCLAFNSPDIPFGPATGDAGRYIPCTLENGCRVSPADFGVGIFKEVVTIPDQSAEGVKTNLTKFHYTVSEDEVDDVWDGTNGCVGAGFTDGHNANVVQASGNELVEYTFCIDYSEGCSGTIRPRDKKTCTVSNYIWRGEILTREE